MNSKDNENAGARPDEKTDDNPQYSLRPFDSFRNPVFRIYFGAVAGHWFSMSMQIVARSLLLYRITESGALLGLMALAQAIPTLLLSLLGGAIADRVQKKHVLITGQSCSGLVTLGIALSLSLGYLGPEHSGSWWLLIVSAALQGSIMGLMMPSRQAIIPEIVKTEQIMNAISLNNMGMNVFRMLAPAAAGILIDAFDFDIIYYVSTALYIMATVFALYLPNTGSITRRANSALKDIREGVHYLRHERTILLVLIFAIFGFLIGLPFMQLMPMFTEDILKVSASGMGFLMSVSGFGAIIGSLVLASLPNKKRGIMLLASGLLMSLALAGFAFSSYWYLSLFLVIFIGLGQTGEMTLGNTLLQYYVDSDYRGRVMSFMMMGIGFGSLGTFFAGLLAEVVGVRWSVGGLSLLLALVTLMALLFTPRVRRLD